MSLGRPPLGSVFASLDEVERSLRAKHEPAHAVERLRLVQDLVARLPHKYLPAATAAEIEATERVLSGEGRGRGELKVLRETLSEVFDQLVLDQGLRWHPLRREERHHSNGVVPPEAGLAVAIPDPIAELAATALEPLGLSLHAEASTARALERVRWFPFNIIVSAFPIEAPARFLEQLRSPASLCRSVGVVLIVNDDQLADAEIYLGRGANRVIPLSRLAADLGEVVTELDQVCERIRIRLPVQVELDGGRRSERWRCENVSRTGMLIRAGNRCRPGQALGLQFRVPGQDRPIRVSAEVVRTTTFGREDFDGMGVRFLSFGGDGQYRLERFLG